MHLIMSSGNSWPFCLGLNVLSKSGLRVSELRHVTYTVLGSIKCAVPNLAGIFISGTLCRVNETTEAY